MTAQLPTESSAPLPTPDDLHRLRALLQYNDHPPGTITEDQISAGHDTVLIRSCDP